MSDALTDAEINSTFPLGLCESSCGINPHDGPQDTGSVSSPQQGAPAVLSHEL